MRFNWLIVILMTAFLFSGILMVSHIKSQTKDVRALTERVEVLERIIYDTQINPNERDKAEREYSAFRL